MTNPNDFTKMFQEMMSTFPVDTSAMQDAFKNSAAFGEKMSKVALDAAEKSTEISSKWTQSTLNKMSDATKAKAEPADYTKAITEFASAQAETAAENMAAFAEVAKKVQMQTVELMMSAGKEFSEEATSAVKKAAKEVTSATKKAASAAK